jgi:uncharacterized membrane protein
MQVTYLTFIFSIALATVQALPLAPRSTPGPGIYLNNNSSNTVTYNFYNNFWNGYATAGANFNNPESPTIIGAGKGVFVSLPSSFHGRVQRGTEQPATWVEFQLRDNNGEAWGDVSLEQGCDGAATIQNADGSGIVAGFSNDVIPGAPAVALNKKPDGTKVIASTLGNWASGPNLAAVIYLNSTVGQEKAYITGGTETQLANNPNGQFTVNFY